MATLGVGVRVWVGWYPDSRARCDPRLQKATINDGPYGPGLARLINGEICNLTGRFWNLRTDSGVESAVAEKNLWPLDGDTDVQTDAERVNETEAECSAS